MNTKELIAALSQAGRTPKKTIARSVQESGKSPIGCFPIYLPEEIIYASGLLPVGMWGGQTAMTEVDRYIQGFCCSVMRANMELGLRGAYQDLRAIVIPTYCDTMKSILANWTVALKEPQVLSYTVLQNRNSSGSLDFILYQNEKLRADLSALTGRTISDGDIEEAFQVYEAYRSAVRRFVALVQEYPVSLSPTDRHLILKAAWFMDKKEYTKQLNQLMDALIAQSLSQTDQSQRKSVYQDIVALTMELQPAIYFSNSNLLWGTNGKVHGLSQKTYWYLCNNEVNVWMEQ